MEKRMKRNFMLVVLGITALGAVVVTPEYTALVHLGGALEAYAIQNQSQATSWGQLAKYFDLRAESRYLHRSLDQSYDFVQRGVVLPEHSESDVILVRTLPIQLEGGKSIGRYVIHTNNGRFGATFKTEEQIQSMFRIAGLPLPKPLPGLPEIDTDPPPRKQSPVSAPGAGAGSQLESTGQTNFRSSPSPPATETPTPSAIPVILIAIFAAVVVGAVAFFLRRNSP